MATDIALTNLKIGIATNAQLFPILIRLSGSDSGQPRADRKSGEVKMSPDGRPTHKVAGKVVSLNRDEKMQEEGSCFVNSIEPLEAELDLLGSAQLYRAEGKIWVKPFVSNDRQSYSITVEKLVAVQQTSPQSGGHPDK